MRDLNLKATEYFEATARLGSVTKAASELSVSPSAVSQQIKALETQFGVVLFRRDKRRLTLTPDGERLFQTTTKAFAALRNARNAISRPRDLRQLTLRASPSFGVRWLSSRIPAFSAEAPDWAIRVDATPEFTNFETESVDLDLRYGPGDWAGLSVTRVMNDLVMPMCSPGYLDSLTARADDPIGRLRAARLIDSVQALMRWDIWLASNRITLEPLAFPYRFDRSSMSIEVARQGGGVALESVNLCLSDLQSGELVPFDTQFPVVDFPAYWLVCPARHLNRRIVMRFSDWLQATCASHETTVRTYLASIGCFVRETSGPGVVDLPDPLSAEPLR